MEGGHFYTIQFWNFPESVTFLTKKLTKLVSGIALRLNCHSYKKNMQGRKDVKMFSKTSLNLWTILLIYFRSYGSDSQRFGPVFYIKEKYGSTNERIGLTGIFI